MNDVGYKYRRHLVQPADVVVGMTWKEAHDRCPKGVIPACHNSTDTVTVSGPAESVATFVAELQKEGVFAKAVHSGGVAFHSYYMSQTAPALKERLQQVSSSALLADCFPLANCLSLQCACYSLIELNITCYTSCEV